MNLLARRAHPQEFPHPDESSSFDPEEEADQKLRQARILLSDMEAKYAMIQSMHIATKVNRANPFLSMWSIAILIGFLSAIPVALLQGQHPHAIAVPIIIGAFLVLAEDLWSERNPQRG